MQEHGNSCFYSAGCCRKLCSPDGIHLNSGPKHTSIWTFLQKTHFNLFRLVLVGRARVEPDHLLSWTAERFSDWLAVSWLLLRIVSRSTFSIALKSDRLNGRQVIMGEQVLAEIGSVWALLHASPPAPCIMIFISSLAITIAMYVQWICGGEQSSF